MVMEISDREVKEVVRNIMHDFSTATDLACIYVDLMGNAQSEKFNFSEFCQYIRRIPAFKMKCKQCDLCGGLEALKKQQCCPYRCHAGLVDFAVPIVKAKQLHGFIVSGQINYDDMGIHYLQEKSDLGEYTQAQSFKQKVTCYSYNDIICASRILNAVTASYFPFNTGQIQSGTINTMERESGRWHLCKDNRPEIKKAVEYISTHLDCDLSLSKLSQEVYLSEAYLSRLFKQEMHTNIINYINQCRISEAEKLLRETKDTIESISRKLGYKRPSYFCKLFRKELGDTPNVYRQKQKLQKND